jgi:hypothetical protein
MGCLAKLGFVQQIMAIVSSVQVLIQYLISLVLLCTAYERRVVPGILLSRESVFKLFVEVTEILHHFVTVVVNIDVALVLIVDNQARLVLVL